eukprot:TRINITY_DN11225_c0_g1_i1.p1 TRINITY_DN11225_c0_g1~~TRINITY_DN11225_c0_g1_i1.p1  ORF type:complete len:290 (+),score=14.25 TRINITY_DN11225_c0_g1_i1:415-1284(+)
MGLQRCSIRDLFNGIYDVCCPVCQNGTSETVHIELDYQTFNAFRQPVPHPPWQLPLHEFAVACQRVGTNRLPTPTCNSSTVLDRARITAFGDSHTRYLVDRFLDLVKWPGVTWLPPRHRAITVGKLQYIDCTVPHICEERLGKWAFSQTFNYSLPHVLLLNSGAWSFGNIQRYVVRELPRLLNKLINLSQNENIRAIWITNYAFPIPQSRRRGNTNNYGIDAANTWTTFRLRSHPITIIDAFSLSLPHHEEVACTTHYICRKSRGHAFGPIGFAVAEAVLQNICLAHQF